MRPPSLRQSVSRTVGQLLSRTVGQSVSRTARVPFLFPFLFLFLASTLAAQAADPGTAIRNVTVFPVVGERVPNGTVVIRGSRIEAVGRDLAVPPGANTI